MAVSLSCLALWGKGSQDSGRRLSVTPWLGTTQTTVHRCEAYRLGAPSSVSVWELGPQYWTCTVHLSR